MQLTSVNFNDIVNWTLAGLALLVSVMSFFWNRRYSRMLFESTNFPDLDFKFEPTDERFNRTRSGMIRYQGTSFHANNAFSVTARNKTNIEAVNASIKLVLTRGLLRKIITIRPRDWEVIPRLGSKTEEAGYFIDVDTASLFPEYLEIEKVPPKQLRTGEIPYDSLVLKAKQNLDKLAISMLVEFVWVPPLRSKVKLKRSSRWLLKPVTNGENTVIAWQLEKVSKRLPFWISSWRPRTLKYN